MNGSFQFDLKKVKENKQTVDDTLCVNSNRRPEKLLRSKDEPKSFMVVHVNPLTAISY